MIVAYLRLPDNERMLEELGVEEAPTLDRIQPYIDEWLCGLFPGRTPDELDHVDYPRLLRMLQVRSIKSVERQRKEWLDGRSSFDNFTSNQVKIMGENDEQYKLWLQQQKP